MPNAQRELVRTTLVFQPGGTPGGIVFSSWTALMAALNVICPVSANGTRPPSTIQYDQSFGATTIPAGAYNLDSVTLIPVNPLASLLTFAAGVTLSYSVMTIGAGATVDYAGAAVLCPFAGASTAELFVRGPIQLTCSGGGKFITASGTANVLVQCITGTMGDATHAILDVAAAGAVGIMVCQAGAFANTNAMTNTGGGTAQCSYDLELPNAQGAGVTVSQLGTVNALTLGLGGDAIRGTPLKDKVTAAVSFALAFALSAAQIATPTIVGSGIVPVGGTTITLPNVVGARYYFDLHAVTLTGTLTFSAGTGATVAAVTAAQLAASGAQGCIVEVTAANVVVRMS